MKSVVGVVFFVGYLVAVGDSASILFQTLAVPVQVTNPPPNQRPGLPDIIYDLADTWTDLQGAMMSGDAEAASYDMQEILNLLAADVYNNPSAKSYIAKVQEEVTAALNEIKLGKSDMFQGAHRVLSLLGKDTPCMTKSCVVFDGPGTNGMRAPLNDFFMDLAGGELKARAPIELGEDLSEPAGELPPEVGTVW